MMRVWLTVVTCVQLVLCLQTGYAEMTTCVQNGELDFRPDPEDCTVFYRCAGTTLYEFTCESGTVFSPGKKVCVHKGTPDDTCSTSSICNTSTDTLIPHDSRCSLYYNCTAPAKVSDWEEHLQECEHPQVYNTDTRRCEHYSMVDCGEREMPLGPCEYKVEECEQCHQCKYVHRSCRGLTDGLNVDPVRPDSAYFIVCVDQRLVHMGKCTFPNYNVQVFDPERRTCVYPNELKTAQT